MKRIFTTICALALVTAGVLPALAAESPAPSQEPDQGCYYPIKVEEYTSGPLDELRIDKVYQLSLGDDPSGIPTGDFERNGRLYYLLDMVRKDEVGVDVQTHTETVTLASDTNKMDAILQRLDAEVGVEGLGEAAQAEGFAHAGSSGEDTDSPGIFEIVQTVDHLLQVVGEETVFFFYLLLVKGVERQAVIA